MAYQWKVVRLQKHRVGTAVIGLVVGVTCTNLSPAPNTTGSSYLDWTVAKEDLALWPPTKASLKTYIKDYLTEELDGTTRAANMKTMADTLVRTYDGDNLLGTDDEITM